MKPLDKDVLRDVQKCIEGGRCVDPWNDPCPCRKRSTYELDVWQERWRWRVAGLVTAVIIYIAFVGLVLR